MHADMDVDGDDDSDGAPAAGSSEGGQAGGDGGALREVLLGGELPVPRPVQASVRHGVHAHGHAVLHAAISSEANFSIQELYIRCKDGKTLLKDQAERVIRCLEAGITRRGKCPMFELQPDSSTPAAHLI
jgi:hypothetical protein